MKPNKQEQQEKASGRQAPGGWQQMNRKQRREWTRNMQAEEISLQVVHPDAAGIDIGNESHYVAVPPSRDSQPVRRFGCTTAELKDMAAWLKQCRIRTVAIVYASHCTSFGRCETFSISKRLLDNLTPLASRGGLGPGSS